MLKKELSPTKKTPNLFNFLHIPAYELLLKFEKESFDKSDIFLSANSTVSKKKSPSTFKLSIVYAHFSKLRTKILDSKK